MTKPVLKQTSQEKISQFEPVRLERLKHFRDGYQVKFDRVLLCPACKAPLLLKYVIVSGWPYLHGDYCLNCLKCGYEALFGIPEDPVVGMELIIWDSQPMKVLKYALKQVLPVCPFHMKQMRLTKIFGDLIQTEPVIRLQWKCPEWFLTEHKTVKRPQ